MGWILGEGLVCIGFEVVRKGEGLEEASRHWK